MSTAQQPARAERPRPTRLFPLYLTPFEEYMLWDDRPQHPMTFVVEFEFEGEVQQEAFRAALGPALQRHPLLQAIVQPAKKNRDCWVTPSDPTVRIDWGALGAPLSLPDGEPIDLRREVGLRVWVRFGAGRTILTTQFHHACADGIGAYQFLGDWLWHYADEVGQPVETPLPANDAVALRRRNRASYDPQLVRDARGKLHLDRRDVWTLASKRMLPLQPGRHADPRRDSPGEKDDRFPGICSSVFNKQVYRKLRAAGERRGQSTNELLLERLLLSMRRWNAGQGRDDNGSYCVMMPLDLREPHTRMGTAANLVSYAMVRRRRDACVDSEALVDSLRREMVQIKRDRQRTTFMNVMQFLTRYPVWLKRWFSGRGCMASAILSNTGDPTKRFTVQLPHEKGICRAGDLRLIDISGVPPMRNGTRATVSIFTYRRELKLCVRCDPALFTKAQTQQFTDLYREQIEALLD